jgi:23S rRNA (pseudouridine1915-N3)-methyltransferase
MRLCMISIGRARADPLLAAIEDYRRRCPFEIRLVEIPARSGLPPARARGEETAAALARVPPGAVLVALDERGEELDSRAFAARLALWRDSGRREVAFLIGGADGLDPGALAGADLLLAFGRMTWPHRLVRLMLVEQLYRAGTILAGHPYHRD